MRGSQPPARQPASKQAKQSSHSHFSSRRPSNNGHERTTTVSNSNGKRERGERKCTVDRDIYRERCSAVYRCRAQLLTPLSLQFLSLSRWPPTLPQRRWPSIYFASFVQSGGCCHCCFWITPSPPPLLFLLLGVCGLTWVRFPDGSSRVITKLVMLPPLVATIFFYLFLPIQLLPLVQQYTSTDLILVSFPLVEKV